MRPRQEVELKSSAVKIRDLVEMRSVPLLALYPHDIPEGNGL